MADTVFMAGRILLRPWEPLRRWRWWVAIGCAVFGVFIEWLEHQLDISIDSVELLGYGLVLPIVIWWLMTGLARVLADQAEADARQTQQQQLTDQLDQLHEWAEVSRFIVRLPADLLPVKRVTLHIYDHPNAQFQKVADWPITDLPLAPSDSNITRCAACLNQPRLHRRAGSGEYCQPLVYSHLMIGALRLEFSSRAAIDQPELALLAAMAPKLALALATALAQPQRLTQVETVARLDERRNLAHELHDSLAQQVGYLQLGLDRLAMCDETLSDDRLREELNLLREVAGEIYQQVRGQLHDLQATPHGDLVAALAHDAQVIGRRTGLQVSIDTYGEPTDLSAAARTHIYGLVRESLNNVQKHARARHAAVRLVWKQDRLIVTVADDGVGFDPHTRPRAGQYGLNLMRERVEALHGCLHIASDPQGTHLTFELPFESATRCPGLPVNFERMATQE